MATTFTRELERLTHSGLELSNPAMDVRDRDVLDRHGEHVGTVADVLVDPDRREVRLLEVAAGGGIFGFGKKSHLVPIEVVISGDPRTVYVDRPKKEILATDEYRPTEGDAEEAQYVAVYQAYGVPPYWTSEPQVRMAGS